MEPRIAEPIHPPQSWNDRFLSCKSTILPSLAWTSVSFVQSLKSRLLSCLTKIFTNIAGILPRQSFLFAC